MDDRLAVVGDRGGKELLLRSGDPFALAHNSCEVGQIGRHRRREPKKKTAVNPALTVWLGEKQIPHEALRGLAARRRAFAPD
jgi:hypothetical protein